MVKSVRLWPDSTAQSYRQEEGTPGPAGERAGAGGCLCLASGPLCGYGAYVSSGP